MRARLSLFTAADGAIILPDLILWAFNLNPGDLLTVSREEGETFRCCFASYAVLLRTLADWGPTVHWRLIEESLRLPMAAMAPRGKLLLPEQAAPLAQPGTSLLLAVPPPAGEGFTLEAAGGRRISAGLFLEAAYTLLPEAGAQVRLPEDLLWVAGLQEGDALTCETSLGQVDFEPFVESKTLERGALVHLGPGGTLRVPDSFLRELRPGWRIRLTAVFNPQAALRLSYEVE